MVENKHFSLVERPGALVFFAWVAFSAAIFFGAYSVKILYKYRAEIEAKSAIAGRERELSYQLERASVKIEETAESIDWAYFQIERLKKQNDDIQQKATNLRKLLYAAVKKNQQQEVAEGKVERDLVQAVEPKSGRLAESASEDASAVGVVLPEEKLLPQLSKEALDEKGIVELVRNSDTLNSETSKTVAEVLTYNPRSKKVFISMGRSNGGISEGNRFAIWREGKHVTDVRVAQVHAVTSTCEVISPVLGGLHSGDTAELVQASAY